MILTEDNFLIYAAKHYDNNNCASTEEFEEDLQRFKYLKKLFFTYKKNGDVKERLILNHIIILYNVFEHRACTKMLILKLEKYLDCLFPFLFTMGYLERYVTGIKTEDYTLKVSDISLDDKIVKKCKEILKEGKN